MIAKLCAWAPTRALAVDRMRRALDEYDVRGLTTNLDFLRQLVRIEDFVQGRYDTGFIERQRALLLAPEGVSLKEPDEAMAAAVLWATLFDEAESAPGSAAPAAPQPAGSDWAVATRRRRLGY
jgi:acetyl/propionyl-CoA carboxylase alpha subunit